MEKNSWGLVVRLVHGTNREQTGPPGYYLLIYILMKSWNLITSFFIKSPVSPASKLKFDSAKQKYEVMSSVSYRCIKRDKGVIPHSFVQDNTNLG